LEAAEPTGGFSPGVDIRIDLEYVKVNYVALDYWDEADGRPIRSGNRNGATTANPGSSMHRTADDDVEQDDRPFLCQMSMFGLRESDEPIDCGQQRHQQGENL
jgi:hypothetical protein